MVIDAGNEVYARINFSSQRYTLWYTRGAGHNAPVIGETEQMFGKKYTAFFERADRQNLTMNLDHAYPAEAGVKKFARIIDFAENQVVLTDAMQLSTPKTIRIKFLSPCKAENISDSCIRIGDVTVDLQGIKLEKISTLPKMNGSWNIPLTAIEFKTTETNYRFTFKDK